MSTLNDNTLTLSPEPVLLALLEAYPLSEEWTTIDVNDDVKGMLTILHGDPAYPTSPGLYKRLAKELGDAPLTPWGLTDAITSEVVYMQTEASFEHWFDTMSALPALMYEMLGNLLAKKEWSKYRAEVLRIWAGRYNLKPPASS